MKALMLVTFVLIISACNKEDKLLPCEINNTFTIEFKNNDFNCDTLVIDDKVYDVSTIKGPVSIDVAVEYGSIYTIDKVRQIDSTGYLRPYFIYVQHPITAKPNACATYIISR